MASGIHIKKSHRGLLHKDLGVASGKKISKGKLSKASKNPNLSAAEKKRITFARNAAKWNKGRRKAK